MGIAEEELKNMNSVIFDLNFTNLIHLLAVFFFIIIIWFSTHKEFRAETICQLIDQSTEN